MTGMKADRTGRSTGRRSNRRERVTTGPRGRWVYQEIEMIESPAWRALTINARRIIERLQLEHSNHGGGENGRLPCTYSDFQRWGVTKKYILAAVVEAEALGFIERVDRGRKKFGNYPGSPSRFRLTFIGTIAPEMRPPTDEWRRFDSIEDARLAAAAAVRAAEAETREEWQRVEERKNARSSAMGGAKA